MAVRSDAGSMAAVNRRPAPRWRHDLRMALTITRREVRDSLRDWRIIIPIVALTLIFPALATFTAGALFRFIEQYGAILVGDRLLPFMLLVVGFFPMSFSLVIALETFVGEKERKSLEPLLATPLTNSQLYLGKVLAALVPPMITSYLGILVYIIGLKVTADLTMPPGLFLQIILLTTIQGVVMVAAAVIVSSQTNTVRAANLLASFIIVPTALLLQIESVILFWGNTDGLWWVILALLMTAFLFVRMGIKIFNREELLGQDIDQLRLRPLAGRFWRRLWGLRPGERWIGPLTWYRRLFADLREIRIPAGMMVLAAGAAVALGFLLTRHYAVFSGEPDQFSPATISANIEALGESKAVLPGLIFGQNLRVVLLAAILGIFTLGVTDVLILMLPWVVLGYLGGLLAQAGQDPLTFYFAAVLPHAVIELPALVAAAAAALRWHASVLAPPPNRTVNENWVLAAADFGRTFIGITLPLLILAAFVEATVTPQVIAWVYGAP